ncbi:hypothetical protein L798_04018 [Zootermopsis nevadensis]|uniref:Uncharacterized protein n=1 Tax=Zootermopsis nevadensis TaxID=136037 RepID=A0A067QT90_ZOONE|nr:hypothetical protein L798_04018 [Zootermopsis nevadensis]
MPPHPTPGHLYPVDKIWIHGSGWPSKLNKKNSIQLRQVRHSPKQADKSWDNNFSRLGTSDFSRLGTRIQYFYFPSFHKLIVKIT